MKKLLFIATFSSFVVTASIASTGSVAWTASPFDQKVFIENIGQFDGKIENTKEKILFGASVDGVELYFTNTGIKYRHIEAVPMTEEEREKVERNRRAENTKEDAEQMMKSEPRYLSIEWVGANRDTKIIKQDSVSFYYTYAAERETITAHAFKKIIYKNLYPNIDAEYIFPEGKKGIEYSLVVHPGGDLSVVKMRCSDAKGLSIDSEGNIVIKSSFGDFIDHAPSSTSEKLKISSAFVVSGEEVSFNVASYDRTQELIIDPWTTNPIFANYNAAYDVNYDLQDNVYVYGSYTPFKLAKLNSDGVVQWIYNNTTFQSYPFDQYGDFTVDELSGTCYLVKGFNFSGASVSKVNTFGTQTGTFPRDTLMEEMWRVEYDRCVNKLVIAGGGTKAPCQAAMLDTNLMTMTPVNVLSANNPNHDFTLLAIDNSTNFCYMATSRTVDTHHNNMLIKCPMPNLLPTAFAVPDRHMFAEVGSIRYIDGDTNNYFLFPNGMNGMAVSPSWLYTYDSDSLKRWNKNTGAFVVGIHVSSTSPIYKWNINRVQGIQVLWGGLSADECDNIYVGVGASIKEYNSSLSLVNTFVLPGTVYDVKLGPNNKLYACGKGYVARIDVPSNSVVTQTSAKCNECDGTATVSSCGGDTAELSYLWNTNPPQTTQTATGLCPGTYTVKVSTTTKCTNISYIDSVTITSGGLKPIITSAMKLPGDEITIPILLEPSVTFKTAKEIDLTVKYDPALLRFINVSSAIGPVSKITSSNGKVSFIVTDSIQLPTPAATIAELHMQALLALYTEGKIEVTSSTFTLGSGEQIAAGNCPATFSLDSSCVKPSNLKPRSTAELEGIYPNPSHTSARVVVNANGSPHIKLEVYDRYGRKIETLADGKLPNEKNQIVINTSTYPNGIYFCRMMQEGKIVTREFNVQK